MEKRTIDPTHILDDKQVKELTRKLKSYLPYEFANYIKDGKVNPENTVRMLSFTNKFKEERLQSGKTFKELAAILKVPQYRLKAIENGRLNEIKPDVLKKYSKQLDLDAWCLSWAEKNTELANKLGINNWEQDEIKI